VPEKNRRYSDAEREAATAALQANGGNITRTAKQINVPPQTLRNWARGYRHPEASRAGGQKTAADLAERLEEIAWQLVDALPGKIKKATLQQASISLGIAIDKMRLLREQATSRVGHEDALSDTERVERLKELARRLNARAAAAAGTPTTNATPPAHDRLKNGRAAPPAPDQPGADDWLLDDGSPPPLRLD